MRVAIIGGGAAGFFSALSVMQHHPNAEVVIFEKSQKVLAKVKISGGGRCNVTNACASIKAFSKAYPRGQKIMNRSLKIFDNFQLISWFESRKVPLVIQEDNCVFPASQNSQSIIDCFVNEAKKWSVDIQTNMGVRSVEAVNSGIQVQFLDEVTPPKVYDSVIIATGGSPRRKGLLWLERAGHKIVDPVPSLFTFNMPNEPITSLMGIVIENAIVCIQGTSYTSTGPLLITHWGMSGPAVLKLSAVAARSLSETEYNFIIQVNWVNIKNHSGIQEAMNEITLQHPNKQLQNIKPFALPERLWLYLLDKVQLPKEKKWNELGKKGMNKLTAILSNDTYSVRGKTTFKEEFVTCGGVSLDSIDTRTMQSRVVPGLYFAGEVLDIDGITGGYNFQAAWTTGYIAGMLK